MPTPNERKGLLFLALVALSGTGVRVWGSRLPPPTSTEANALDRQLERVDSARSAKRSREKRSKAKAETTQAAVPDSQPVDLSSAPVARIEALPGIGPALAKRIVAHRDSVGSIADMAALCDVRGIGPTLAERLRPLVTFEGRTSPVSDACDSPSKEAGNPRSPRGRKRP